MINSPAWSKSAARPTGKGRAIYAVLALSLAVIAGCGPDSTRAPVAEQVSAPGSTSNQIVPDFTPDHVSDPSASIPSPIPWRNMTPGEQLVVNGASCVGDVVPGGYFIVRGVKYEVKDVIEVSTVMPSSYVIGFDAGSGRYIEAAVGLALDSIPFGSCVEAAYNIYEMQPQADVNVPPGVTEPMPVPTPAVPAAFLGTWGGGITQQNPPIPPFTIRASIVQGSVGSTIASANYTGTSPCSVHWTLVSADATHLIVNETVDSGSCFNNIKVTLTDQGDGTLGYDFEDGNGHGVLSHQ